MPKKSIAFIAAVLLIFSMLPEPALGAGVDLALSKSYAAVGDRVTASGNAGANEALCIKLVDSSGNIVLFDIIRTDECGYYSYSFIIPPVSSGTLTVTVGSGCNVASELLQVAGEGSGTIDSIALTKPAAKIFYTVGEALDISGLEVSGFYSDGSSGIEEISVADISGFDSSRPEARQILTIRVGDKAAEYAVTISEPLTAEDSENIMLGNTPLTITIPEDIENAGIQLVQESPLPPIKVKSAQVEMTIPDNTTVSGSEIIRLPEVKPGSSVKVAGARRVDLLIQLGSDTNTITFNKPVRLLLKGQGSKSAGFIDNEGEFKGIGKPASLKGLAGDGASDAVAEVFAEEGLQEGAVSAGADLVIWTKHFTSFLAYTAISSGLPSVIPEIEIIEEYLSLEDEIVRSQIIGSRGGIIKMVGTMLAFPLMSVSEDVKISVKKMKKDSIPVIPPEFELLGEVYEITADKNVEFAKPVTITLYFDPENADSEQDELGIYCWGEDKQWLLLEQIKTDLQNGKISGMVNHFSIFALLLSEKEETAEELKQEIIPPLALEYMDVAGHWAEKLIMQLTEAGAISGYPDGSFRPDSTISRAEFIAMLVKAFEIKPESAQVFSDTTRHWARDSINAAVAQGIVKGYEESIFGPDDFITREQMAVAISKAASFSGGEGRNYVDGNQIADWAREAVLASSAKGVISGYPDNTFRPQANATRAEAVSVIAKALTERGGIKC